MFLKKLSPNSMKPGAGALREEVVKYRPGMSNERIKTWMTSVMSRATNPESKAYAGQLQSLVNYYTRPVKGGDSVPEIDWNQWKDSIKTEGLVDKVKQNYETLAKEEYSVESISSMVIGSDSKELDSISNELAYHCAVWANAYTDYNMFLLELEDFTTNHDYAMHEIYDLYYGMESDLQELVETGNNIPGSKDDVNLRGYYAAQFNWGKKVVSFYKHPADENKAFKATKNIFGR